MAISHCLIWASPLSSLALNFNLHNKGWGEMISEVLSISVQLGLEDGVLDRQTDRQDSSVLGPALGGEPACCSFGTK